MTDKEREIESTKADIKALERTLRSIDRTGQGSAARHNVERVLALKRERLAMLQEQATGQGRLP